MTTHSSILAWEIPWTKESGGLELMGSQNRRTWLSDQTTKMFPKRCCWKLQKSLYKTVVSIYVSPSRLILYMWIILYWIWDHHSEKLWSFQMDQDELMERMSNVTELILLGLTQNPGLQTLLFAVFLIVYLITLQVTCSSQSPSSPVQPSVLPCTIFCPICPW